MAFFGRSGDILKVKNNIDLIQEHLNELINKFDEFQLKTKSSDTS